MAWHSGKPTDSDFLSASVQHIRENFAELEPMQPHVAELVDLTALQPHIAALLDSRIVEMGSNSNGEYVRWENGLQVCFTRLTTSANQDTLWTLPAAFIDSEWVFSGGVGESFDSGVRVITFEGRTTNSISLRVL